MTREIAHVSKVNAAFESDLADILHSLPGRCRQVPQLIHRKEPGKVHRHLASQVLPHPLAHAPDFIRLVVHGGDDESGQLNVFPLGVSALDVGKHRSERTIAHIDIELFVEGFQVDVQGIDGIEELKKVLEYVEGVHLKDTDGGYKSWHFPALGQGIVDFPTVFRLLNERGMCGPFTIEIEGIGGEETTPELVSQRMSRSAQYLRDIGALE